MSARGRVAAGAAGAVLTGVAIVVFAAAIAGGGGTPARADDGERLAAGTATAEVRHGTLTAREAASGTLGYAAETRVTAGGAGTVTGAPQEGTVLAEGHSLIEVDGRRTLWLLRGARPAWRDFAPGMDDGTDVTQLEAALRRLGDDPEHDMTVDGTWTWATTAAVKRFQDARGLTEDGTLERGEVVFVAGIGEGGARVGAVEAQRGDALRAGAAVAKVSSRERQVHVDLDAERQTVAREGEAVTVTLPDGTGVRGAITEVGRVATTSGDEQDPSATIPVTIALRGARARGLALDRAPVQVRFVLERERDVDVVPATALLARPGGGYAVELVGPGAVVHEVPVEVGLQASGEVAITGEGIRDGAKVVVPE